MLERSWGLVAAAGLVLAACGSAPGPVELLPPGNRLLEAVAAGEGREAILAAAGEGVRINDVLRRALPAGPPGRLRFAVDIPKRARLTFAVAIDPRHHDRPGVEFTVKVRKRGREDLIWTQLLDPIAHENHRRWVEATVDLSSHAGRGQELVLETHGFEETGEPARAWRATPAISVPDRRGPPAPLFLVDTPRADHTGPYGYERPTTP